MVRYGVPIFLACIYVVGASWIVRNEGRSYRDSLHRPNPGALTAPAPRVAPPSIVDGDERDDATSEPAVPRPEPPPVKPISIPGDHPEPKKAEAVTSSTPVPTTPSGPAAVSPKPPPPAGAPPAAGELAARVSQWKNDPFWSQPDLVKSWNLDHFTVEDDRQLGEQLNRLILELNPADAGSGLRRVRETAKPLLNLLHSKDGEYKFFVLNSEVANAFSHPGGYIYVSRKLLEMIPEDEPAPLEFVLGHEIAHLERHHALACLKANDVRKFGDGTLQKLYFLIIPHGYPDKFEYEADAWAYNKLRQLRRSEHDCLKFLRLLDSYAKGNGFEHGRGKVEDLLKERRGDPRDDRENSPIDNHMRSHPAAYDRVEHLKELRGPRP